MIYITLQQASADLRLDIDFDESGSPSEEDPRLEILRMAVEDAEAAVLAFLKTEQIGSPPDWPWDAETVPRDIRRATLIVVSKFYDKNGTPFEDDGAETALLVPYRTPTVA